MINPNQMNPNMGMMNGGFAPMGGTGYQFNPGYQGVNPIRRGNFLTDDEINELAKKTNRFNIALTKEERLRGQCNHQKADGTGDTLVENNDGTSTCQICGYTFKPLDAYHTTRESLLESVADIIDILQTIKLLYFDMDSTAGREYFQIIPLIEKIPDLFDLAVKDYSKHENYNPYSYNTHNLGAFQMFNMLVGAMNSGAGYQQQPVYNNQQPQFNNGYMPNWTMGNPNPQMGPGMYGPSNGFGYAGAGMNMGPGYQAQTTGYQYGMQPQQAMAPTPNMNNQQPQVSTVPENTTVVTTPEGEKSATATFKA